MLGASVRNLARRGSQVLRLDLRCAYAGKAASTSKGNNAVDLAKAWDDLQNQANTNEAKKELADLRRIVSDLTKQPEEVKPIDWDREFDDFDKDIIAKCKQAVEGIENDVPEFNLEDLVKEAEEEFKPLISQSKEMAAQADKEIKKLEKELQALNHLQEKLSSMTAHEALASSPEIAAEVDKEISEGNYMP